MMASLDHECLFLNDLRLLHLTRTLYSTCPCCSPLPYRISRPWLAERCPKITVQRHRSYPGVVHALHSLDNQNQQNKGLSGFDVRVYPGLPNCRVMRGCLESKVQAPSSRSGKQPLKALQPKRRRLPRLLSRQHGAPPDRTATKARTRPPGRLEVGLLKVIYTYMYKYMYMCIYNKYVYTHTCICMYLYTHLRK